MAGRPRYYRRIVAPLVFALVAAVLIGPSALAAPGTAVGVITPSPVPAGTTMSYSFTLAPTSGQIGSFNLTAALGWTILSLDSAPSGVSLASSTQIQGRGLTITSSSPLTIGFTAQAPCATSNATWGLAARAGSNFTGSSLSVDPSSSLTTSLSGTCRAAFVAGRSPADAAFNGNPRSENITSVPYTPTGLAIQALVTDANGNPRSGISVMLQLTTNPTGATLSGPITATSDSQGFATFQGNPGSNPITIDEIGLDYAVTPTGTGVVGTESGLFGIYQEGEPCTAGQSCVVHGNSNDHRIEATVSADTPSGSLAVLVSELGLDCSASIPAGYTYTPLSAEVIAWQFTGTGSQTITILIDKTLIRGILNRGNTIDFCYLVEGIDAVTGEPKTFISKFGVETSGPALISFCSPTITENCIVSETATQGGDRLVTVTVEDGKGRA